MWKMERFLQEHFPLIYIPLISGPPLTFPRQSSKICAYLEKREAREVGYKQVGYGLEGTVP